ncbi:hypothetical protein CROQUDRAFT_70474 [Cronartium quercuum f. sp. fusiforme G11]|uniref:DASH complex subunit ASK1 n=1 Tax=Cronartium quercuum f. sp. fusiforme G11 TaxID=708437 RepID=A0A9P6NXV6_9BASI|nr:hypothetical protein CROQUDRAFT_70474 [Cronartium quercuum f. sp. fusiforme G11]
MSSSSRRLFYDPKHPRLLSDTEIEGLSPAECDAACLQIDQILVSLLQNIDANFGRTHRTITQKILPEVERYGEASRGIWEGLKFWQGFFEASANVQLSGYDDEIEAASNLSKPAQDLSAQLDPVEDDLHQDASQHPGETQTTLSNPSTFRQPKSLEPILDSTKHNPAAVDVSHQSGSTASLRRPPGWDDLSLDSPDTTLLIPSAADISLVLNNSHSNSLTSGVSASPLEHDDEVDRSVIGGGTTSAPRKSNGKGSMLLHQVIMKNMINNNHERPNVSTPMRPSAKRSDLASGRLIFPTEVTQPNWDGITDLRKTALDGFASPSKKTQQRPIGTLNKGKSREWEDEDSLMVGISPPQTIQFSIPRSKLARTPAKEAARLVTRDILETARFRAGYANPTDLEDSPLPEPPSVLREWSARGYASMFRDRTGVEANRKGFEEEEETYETTQQPEDTLRLTSRSKDATIESRPSGSRDVSKSLIDLRDGDTDRLSSKGPLDHLEDRDDPLTKRPFLDSSEDEGPSSSAAKRILLSTADQHVSNQQDQSDVFDEDGSTPNSPTLFGVRAGPSQTAQANQPSCQSQLNAARAGTSKNQRPSAHQFVPMQPDHMDTFFGGDLLESECFEPSPLQGKRVKNIEHK